MNDDPQYGPAFEEGYEAFKRGVKEKDCPYDMEGEWGNWADWVCGWGRAWCEDDVATN